MKALRIIGTALALCLAAAGPSLAQAPPPAGPVTIQQAVQYAERNYPEVRADVAEIAAANSGVALAKTAYLPRTDFHYQVNRATRNNIFGLMFPNDVIAPISGPASEGQVGTSTFGNAVGLAFRWEPFDFGLRKANVEVARRRKATAEAGKAVTEYEVSLAVTDAFFSVLAAQQAVSAARANVDRMEVFLRTVSALAIAELRPGADESRARAELARARSELIAAERREREGRLNLGRWMGVAGQQIEVAAGALLEEPPPPDQAAADFARHPIAAAQAARVDEARARRRSIAKEYRPKFEVLSSVYGRGTGASLDGTFQGGGHGLYPNTGNWAVGLGLSFAIFDYQQNRKRQEVETHQETAAAARLDTLVEQLKSEAAKARADIDAARQVAALTPDELEAARSLEVQAQARYKTGLGNVVEVADAQRLLRQAETKDALARLAIWRALFALAAAEHNMEQLLARASK